MQRDLLKDSVEIQTSLYDATNQYKRKHIPRIFYGRVLGKAGKRIILLE